MNEERLHNRGAFLFMSVIRYSPTITYGNLACSPSAVLM